MNVQGCVSDIIKNGLPNHGFYKITNSLICVRIYLIQKALFGEEDKTGFCKFIETNFPEFVKIISDILCIFIKHGYDSPDKQKSIISDLITKYHLEQNIRQIILP